MADPWEHPDLEGPFGEIVLPGDIRHQIEPAFVWTLARMLHYEGGRKLRRSALALLWTVAQRQWYLRRWRHRDPQSFIEAFSQPINPAFRRDGKHCVPGGRYARTDHCAPHRLDRRDIAAVIPWPDLAVLPRTIALDFARGYLAMPDWIAGYVDWAVKPGAGARIKLRFDLEIRVSGSVNRFGRVRRAGHRRLLGEVHVAPPPMLPICDCCGHVLPV